MTGFLRFSVKITHISLWFQRACQYLNSETLRKPGNARDENLGLYSEVMKKNQGSTVKFKTNQNHEKTAKYFSQGISHLAYGAWENWSRVETISEHNPEWTWSLVKPTLYSHCVNLNSFWKSAFKREIWILEGKTVSSLVLFLEFVGYGSSILQVLLFGYLFFLSGIISTDCLLLEF